jgi:hypothetical protein
MWRATAPPTVPSMTDYSLRSPDANGTLNEVAITPEQALDLGAGRAVHEHQCVGAQCVHGCRDTGPTP